MISTISTGPRLSFACAPSLTASTLLEASRKSPRPSPCLSPPDSGTGALPLTDLAGGAGCESLASTVSRACETGRQGAHSSVVADGPPLEKVKAWRHLPHRACRRRCLFCRYNRLLMLRGLRCRGHRRLLLTNHLRRCNFSLPRLLRRNFSLQYRNFSLPRLLRSRSLQCRFYCAVSSSRSTRCRGERRLEHRQPVTRDGRPQRYLCLLCSRHGRLGHGGGRRGGSGGGWRLARRFACGSTAAYLLLWHCCRRVLRAPRNLCPKMAAESAIVLLHTCICPLVHTR